MSASVSGLNYVDIGIIWCYIIQSMELSSFMLNGDTLSSTSFKKVCDFKIFFCYFGQISNMPSYSFLSSLKHATKSKGILLEEIKMRSTGRQ